MTKKKDKEIDENDTGSNNSNDIMIQQHNENEK